MRLRGPEWRRTTIATMDAMRAARLKAEFNAKQAKDWPQSDHNFWRELLALGGFEQPAIDGGGNVGSD